MQNKNFACYSLIASAMILAGLLFMQLHTLMPSAEANMVLNRNSLTMLTAPTAQGADSLFIIDSRTNRLLIYQTDIGQDRLELVQTINLADVGNNAGATPRRIGR